MTLLFLSYLISDPLANAVDSSFSLHPEYYYYYFLTLTAFAKQSGQYEPIKTEIRTCPSEASNDSQFLPEAKSKFLEWPAKPYETWPVTATIIASATSSSLTP